MTPTHLLLAFISLVTIADVHGADHWPSWRGPHGTGASTMADPPVYWSETENVRWKTAIPGKGRSSPAVSGHRVFVTTAVPLDANGGSIVDINGQQVVSGAGVQAFRVLALDAQTGKVLWTRTAAEQVPHGSSHVDGSWASASPVTDGEHVYASFGSQGMYCYTLDGGPVWVRDLGDTEMLLGFGEGSSPILAGDALIVKWDHQGDSFLAALDKRTGEDLWRTPRDETSSWGTPVVDGTRIVTSGPGGIRAYDVETGTLLWSYAAKLNSITSAVVGDGLAYAVSTFEDRALLAMRVPDSPGEDPSLVWQQELNTPTVSTPLLMDGLLYVVKGDQGILMCLDAATGEVVYEPQRLEGVRGVYASPVGAGGRVYIAGRQGAIAVVRAGRAFQLLAVNRLDDAFSASPAAVGDALYLRGDRNLYCLAEMGRE